MSNYRDDSHEIIVVSDETFGKFRAMTEDVVRVGDALFFGVAILCSSAAIASDEVIDNTSYVFTDTAVVSDTVISILHARQLSTDTIKASDSSYHTIGSICEDVATVSDKLLSGSTGSLAAETAIVSDSTTGQRIVRTLASDIIKVSDSYSEIHSDLIEDSAIASSSAFGVLRAADLIEDSAVASDTIISSVLSFIEDSVKVSDELIGRRTVSTTTEDKVFVKDALFFNRQDLWQDSVSVSTNATGRLYARDLTHDVAIATTTIIDSIIQSSFIDDVVIANDSVIDRLYSADSWHDVIVVQDDVTSAGGYRGQTWTANLDSWAMSRYNPYNYNRLVVIDGTLYGEAEDGIYKLDQEVSPVVASVVTGKMDLGRGALTHPNAAYLEYELAGQASMTVHTTQKGVEQQYTYVLPNELADELTNGRFIFGRGLRGRHFSFELTMVGTHGYINDLSVDHQPTSRRV